MNRIFDDLRATFRSLTRRPVTTLACVCLLGTSTGIGASIFAVTDPFLFKPLPYRQPHQLALITFEPKDRNIWDAALAWVPTLGDLSERRDLFQSVGAFRVGEPFRARRPSGPVLLAPIEASANYFEVLGVGPQGFAEFETAANSTGLGIFTAQAARNVAGSTAARFSVETDTGSRLTAIATLPDTFVFPKRGSFPPTDVVLLRQVRALIETERSLDGTAFATRRWSLIGRLQPGVTTEVAERALASSFPADYALTPRVIPLAEYVVGARTSFAVGACLAGVILFVVAATSVSQLLLARGSERLKELACRECLGANRRDIARLLAVEFGALAAGAGVLALWFCHFTLSLLTLTLPDDLTVLGSPRVTLRVVSVIAGTCLGIMAVGGCTAVAAWRLLPTSLPQRLAATEGRLAMRLRLSSLFVQAALSTLLLHSALLLGHSYGRLISQNTGLDREVIVVPTSYPRSHTGIALQASIEETLGRLERLPAVASAAATFGALFNESSTITIRRVAGRYVVAHVRPVTTSYFKTIGTPLLDGGALEAAHTGESGVVVNQAFVQAARFDRSPVGEAVGDRSVIVGVSADALDTALDASPVPTLFKLMERPGADCVGACPTTVTYLMRLRDGHGLNRGVVARILSDVQIDAAMMGAWPASELLFRTVMERAFVSATTALFALGATLACGVGIYGLIAHMVLVRTRELAIRQCLGASRPQLLRCLLSYSAVALAAGATVGSGLAVLVGRTARHLLFEVSPLDLVSWTVAAGAMVGLATISCTGPLARTLRLKLASTLRVE